MSNKCSGEPGSREGLQACPYFTSPTVYFMVPEIGLWCDNFACVINNSLGTSTHHHVNKTAKYAWPSIPSSERNTYEQNRP